MKIIVLHGDDEKRLYERLQKFVSVAKERGWELTYLNESNSSVREQLSTSSLFSNDRFFVLKDIKNLGKKEVEWISSNSEKLEGTLIIYHIGRVPVAVLKSLPKETKVEEFKLPVLLWNFLDGITPGNSERIIKNLHKIVETEAVEFVFTLISKLFRDLYWAKTEPQSMPYPSWRVGKIKSQASKFTIEKLEEIISLLSEIDIKVKSSKAKLIDELDLMIIKQLE
jgi:DNA polymerase III delta subunit